jgi:signal transduction histidine kinase/DNA-binding response OmpR family regulator/ligand-binding sensor domain-containing protein
MKVNLLFTLLLCSFLKPLHAQLKYDWLTTSQGLSQGYIHDIIQDRDGFMWFGTKDGLNRYDGYTFKEYTYNIYDPNSISNNTVHHLYEDSKGRIWAITDNGINIYDKNKDNFRRIMHDPKNENSLADDKISLPIIELNDGRFLVMPEEESIHLITLPDDFLAKDLAPEIVRLKTPEVHNATHLFKDKHGKVWLLADNILYEFIPGNSSLIMRKEKVNFGQTYTEATGEVWTNDMFFSKIEDTELYPLFSKHIANGHGTFFLLEADKNRLWLGITDSAKLEIYDTKNWTKGKPLDPEKCRLYSFSNITPTKFYKDRTGIVWVGTNGYGVRKYTTDTEQFNHIGSGFSVRKIVELPNNQTYAVGWGEIKKFDANLKLITTEKDKLFFKNYEFIVGNDQTIWGFRKKRSGLNEGLVDAIENINPATGAVKSYKINAAIAKLITEPKMEDSKGYIWFVGFGGNMYVLNPETAEGKIVSINTDLINPMLKGAQITALYEDADGTIWAGTETGLAKVNFEFNAPAKTQVRWYNTNPDDIKALSYSHVSSMMDDAADKNILWVATKGGGLNRLDKRSNTFLHITTKEGLCNNVVYGILSDAEGNIWGSTNNGIFCLLKNANKVSSGWQFRHFTKAAGLQEDEFNTNAYTKLKNGYLAFGGVNGLNIFDPAVVLQKGFIPNVFITKILLGNKEILPDDESGVMQQSIEFVQGITLNYKQDIVTLEFSSLDFTAPGQNKYRYKLEGVDDGWVESGNRRTATYVHLPSGNYTFKVQGSNSKGEWSSKIVELDVVILPPWWQTWGAYTLYILIVAIGIGSYFKFRLNKAKLQAQLNFEQQEAIRIKELDAVKTQLYTNITHEFRTPLTVILGMANQVKNEPDKFLDKGVDMILRNGENLLKLVNEMLDLSKLESGKMILNLRNGDFIAYLRYIVESFQSLASAQQKQFHFLANADVLQVEFDAEKTRQIITNLFSNALKFTPENGNIYVSVSYQPISNSNMVEVEIKVKDTGIGIPENQIPHIFDRFTQLDNSHTRKAEGTGIGLALTKELIKLMNGTIGVKSPPVGANKGTEFIIRIPMTKSDLIDSSQTIIPAQDEKNVKAHTDEKIQIHHLNETISHSNVPIILLVEDNEDVVGYTAGCLTDYRLLVGRDGREGFDIAIEKIPDIIITDVMMPYVDGFEMVKKLRLDERTSHIPVIILTAKADIQSKLEGLESGADVYLQKPFHKEELLLRIKKLLELRKNLQQYYRKQIGILSPNETHKKENPEISIEEKAEHEFVIKVREIIEANFNNYTFSVEQLCKLLFMSHSQLHRKLYALIDCSPNKFIRIVRLNKSKELLTNHSLSIATVALECGYNDPGYFTRVFKQEFGITPQEWRQSSSEFNSK